MARLVLSVAAVVIDSEIIEAGDSATMKFITTFPDDCFARNIKGDSNDSEHRILLCLKLLPTSCQAGRRD